MACDPSLVLRLLEEDFLKEYAQKKYLLVAYPNREVMHAMREFRQKLAEARMAAMSLGEIESTWIEEVGAVARALTGEYGEKMQKDARFVSESAKARLDAEMKRLVREAKRAPRGSLVLRKAARGAFRDGVLEAQRRLLGDATPTTVSRKARSIQGKKKTGRK